MNNLFDVVETCLQEMNAGAELEAVLHRYPELADELRPILQASIDARDLTGPAPSAQVVQRNRAKLLQQAASVRTEKPGLSVWFASIQQWAIAMALLILFLFSGTSLVRAASGSLPGDSLYAVKRSWENLTLALTFDSQERKGLQVQFANERLEELHELFASGRTAMVDFAGIVSREHGDGWWISNILVIVSKQSAMPSQPIRVGAAVHVYGTTGGDGIVLAQRIELLPVGAALPDVKDTKPEIEQPQAATQSVEDDSGQGSEDETPEVEETETPAVTAAPEIESISGTLTSIDGDIWEIDDISVDIRDDTIEGTPAVGAQVRAEGYFGSDGVFVALRIEIFNAGLDQDNSNSSINADDENSGSNTNNNDNGDDNQNNSSDDDGHSGGNSGDGGEDDGSGSGSGG